MKHIPSLDGVRGVAALMVVMFHYMDRKGTGPLGIFASLGWTGVDVFLVLSGFLITTILYEQRGTDHYYRNFYTRRALRLFPLFYFILFSICLLTPFLHIHWHLPQIGFFFYSANYVLLLGWTLGNLGPFNVFHIWTLALEEQFYLVWPWLVGNLSLSRKRLVQICAGAIVIAPVLRFGLLKLHFQPWLVGSSLPTRMDSLLIGAALALIPLPSLRTARLTALAAALPIPVLIWWGKTMALLSYPMETVGYSCFAFLYAALLVMSMYPATLTHRFFTLRPLRFYGKYSYGLYLWHYLFVQWFDKLHDRIDQAIPSHFLGAIASFLTILLISTLIALASYHLLEQPFLRLKGRFKGLPAKPAAEPTLPVSR